MNYSIQACGVGKRFRDIWVLKYINVSFEYGKIYGLIGRNGSGKTMLLRIISGLASPSEGIVKVEGKVLGIDCETPDSIGAIIETPGFLPNETGLANLVYLACLRSRIGKDRCEEAMTLCGLDPASKKKVGKYSLGMRQRLGIAQAIMENPDILILDEPMNGLDNEGVRDIKKLLNNVRDLGNTIIIASHHMDDISELCDEVYYMDGGKLNKRAI